MKIEKIDENSIRIITDEGNRILVSGRIAWTAKDLGKYDGIEYKVTKEKQKFG